MSYSTFWIALTTQDPNCYPDWGVKLRKFWRTGWNGLFRIVAFWGSIPVLTICVISVLFGDVVDWDDVKWSGIRTDEVMRAYLAAVITILDLLILIQVCVTANYEVGITERVLQV